LAISLDTGCPQPGEAVSINRTLLGEEFLDRQHVSGYSGFPFRALHGRASLKVGSPCDLGIRTNGFINSNPMRTRQHAPPQKGTIRLKFGQNNQTTYN
jgi:hypothetical protein